jgi:predicted nucleic acid-binding protein
MKNIFLDTNVLIDFLADRKPFFIEAAKLFDYSLKKESNEIRCHCFIQQYILHPETVMYAFGDH